MTTEQISPEILTPFLAKLTDERLNFAEVLAFIDQYYDYTPVAFVNGKLSNQAGENEGSCRVFGFALLNKLDETTTLALFAEHYRSVQANPSGSDHANIRNFLAHGRQGLSMPINCLTLKQ